MMNLSIFLLSISLIGIIFLRVPKESLGLSSLAKGSNVLGSPSSSERLLNILITIGILIYVLVAIQLNFASRSL